MSVKNITRRRERLLDLRKRIKSGHDAYERCRVYPCNNRTTADRGTGLNRLYCRQHVEHYRRHGSYVKRSYSAGELRPYRMAALRWLRDKPDNSDVRLATDAVARLYSSAGAHVEAFRLAGKPPRERANAIWAQLRERRVDPLEILAIWLAVDARLRNDPQADRHQEYRQVQAAKLVLRTAGGAHKRWEQEGPVGRVKITELHKYPSSRGQVLRVLGKMVADACNGLIVAECG